MSKKTDEIPPPAPLPFEPPPPVGRDGWVGWVVRSTPKGWEWCRLALSPDDLEVLRVGDVKPADMRALVAAYIERDMLSDRLADPTQWRP